MHNQFKAQKFKHLMLAMGPRDLNSAPYSPVHCSSHSMTSFQSSELTELPVVENGQLFAQRAHNACTARAQRTVRPQRRGGGKAYKHRQAHQLAKASSRGIPTSSHTICPNSLTKVIMQLQQSRE